MKIILIGGSGFIGNKLAKKLIEKNFNILILDKNKPSSFAEYFRFFDVSNKDSFQEDLFESNDIIINLAAVHKDNEEKHTYELVNVDGSKNICNLAEKKNIKHIIFISSVAVYGFAKENTDENGRINPFNEYGKSKAKAEKVFLDWREALKDSRKLCIIRPTVVFGPGNRGNVFNLINQIVRNRFLMIGDGKNIKSLAYVDNLVEFILFMLSRNEKKEIFNYADKPDLDMNGLISLIKEKTNKKSFINIRIPRFFIPLVGHSFDLISKVISKELSISYIRLRKFVETTMFSSSFEKIGFKAPYSIQEGLNKTLEKDFSEHLKN